MIPNSILIRLPTSTTILFYDSVRVNEDSFEVQPKLFGIVLYHTDITHVSTYPWCYVFDWLWPSERSNPDERVTITDVACRYHRTFMQYLDVLLRYLSNDDLPNFLIAAERALRMYFPGRSPLSAIRVCAAPSTRISHSHKLDWIGKRGRSENGAKKWYTIFSLKFLFLNPDQHCRFRTFSSIERPKCRSISEGSERRQV